MMDDGGGGGGGGGRGERGVGAGMARGPRDVDGVQGSVPIRK